MSIQSKFYMAMIASGLSAGIIVHVGVESSYCFGFADRRPLVPSLQCKLMIIDTAAYANLSQGMILLSHR